MDLFRVIPLNMTEIADESYVNGHDTERGA